jgi:hypothetical protein
MSLWVVDDGSTTDKVFKYTLTGSLLGSWTIDAANSHPTGLTLNPTSPSDIWIVDSGTKTVYQYTAAAGRTSGSQNAVSSFALAANNTNPQDIADPPAAGTLLSAADGWRAETQAPATRPLLETVAAPSRSHLSLPLWLVGRLAQTTPVVSLSSINTSQPVIHATLAPSVGETLSPERPAASNPGQSILTTETCAPRHRAVDQVFSDPALELLDGELLHRQVAAV